MGIIFDEPKYPVLDKAPRFWKTGMFSCSAPPSPGETAFACLALVSVQARARGPRAFEIYCPQ